MTVGSRPSTAVLFRRPEPTSTSQRRRRYAQQTDVGNGVTMTSDFAGMTFTRFYRFPHIEKMRAFARLKLYQTALIAASAPLVVYGQLTGVVDEATMRSSIVGAAFSCAALYAVSGYTRNFIGVMALNESRNVLRVSHLTFWGGRREIYAPVDDVVPIADAGEDPSEMYMKFTRYSNNTTLYYSVRFGGVESVESFRRVFGKVDVPIVKKKKQPKQ